MCKIEHHLDYERTDDMSVLSHFYCGVNAMDDFIHKHLQEYVYRTEGLESYIIKEEGQIVAMTAFREKPLELKTSDGNMHIIPALEIEYLAVRKDQRDNGIGETIIEWIDNEARINHPDCAYLSVNALVDEDYRYTAVPFYQKCHFKARKKIHAMAEAVRMTRIIKPKE